MTRFRVCSDRPQSRSPRQGRRRTRAFLVCSRRRTAFRSWFLLTKKQFSDNKTIQTARNVINSYWKYAHPELGVIQDTASDLKNTVGRLYDISVSGEKDFQTKKNLFPKEKTQLQRLKK
uniref:Uncharacterized protein n=1 Tax=uncultured marine virus TaxID=186617 RepID=A0A0F7L0T3_9VIRU|nr:hypothetical protein [uncultured marine virus]